LLKRRILPLLKLLQELLELVLVKELPALKIREVERVIILQAVVGLILGEELVIPRGKFRQQQESGVEVVEVQVLEVLQASLHKLLFPANLKHKNPPNRSKHLPKKLK
jgi:hypothetical protein